MKALRPGESLCRECGTIVRNGEMQDHAQQCMGKPSGHPGPIRADAMPEKELPRVEVVQEETVTDGEFIGSKFRAAMASIPTKVPPAFLIDGQTMIRYCVGDFISSDGIDLQIVAIGENEQCDTMVAAKNDDGDFHFMTADNLRKYYRLTEPSVVTIRTEHLKAYVEEVDTIMNALHDVTLKVADDRAGTIWSNHIDKLADAVAPIDQALSLARTAERGKADE